MIGCKDGRDAAHLAHAGFVVHAMDVSSASFEHLARYGVHTHCANPSEPWLFEDAYFDFVIDAHRFPGDLGKQGFYMQELRRVLRPGGCYLLSGASCRGELRGFDVVAENKKNKIMKKI
jgi:SAM-dependent methyltransferase